MSVKVDLEIAGVVVGAKKSQLRIKYMPVKTMEELKTILKKANVKIQKQGIYSKSFFKDYDNKYIFFNYNYVLWVERDGLMSMTYDVDDDERDIKEFIDKIEKSEGGALFFSTRNGALNRIEELNPPPEYIYQTKFTDKEIITKVLNENNITPKTVANGLEFSLSGFSINLYETKEGNYELKAVGKGDTTVVENTLKTLTERYDKIVQINICNSIKQKVAKSPTMRLVQEEQLEDNSVLITIGI